MRAERLAGKPEARAVVAHIGNEHRNPRACSHRKEHEKDEQKQSDRQMLCMAVMTCCAL